ncbi:phosphoheptose isomerase [Gracilimonas sp. BCB1]|uniref:phosphoheptose isomerase n=1 Tax=Gracilimonas sp. BCB1 TaxID=3152362 RepID=UPI0032D9851B
MSLTEKEKLFNDIKGKLESRGFEIEAIDSNRPWGGFFVIEEEQAQKFIDTYFHDDVEMAEINISGKLSSKVLVVEPQKRLSWQYHHRRTEMWHVVEGPVGVVRSMSDEQGEVLEYQTGDLIILKKGERHRLVGLQNWGIIAEIWQHVDAENPSDEDDIVRLEDDFGR